MLDKKIGIGQPRRIEHAKVMVANTAMDTDKIKIYGARVKVTSLAKVAEIEAAEKEKMEAQELMPLVKAELMTVDWSQHCGANGDTEVHN